MQLVLQTVDYKKRICAFYETVISEDKSVYYKCLKNYNITICDLQDDDGCGCDR
jgi:hypothetical protein